MKTYQITVNVEGDKLEWVEQLVRAMYVKMAVTVEEMTAARLIGLPWVIGQDGNLTLSADLRLERATIDKEGERIQDHAWLLLNYWAENSPPADTFIQARVNDDDNND